MSLERRIRAEIEDRIRSGEWRPGHRIPFEHELVARYGCARATVNKALTALSRAGLIERRRRAGSFVAFPHVQSAVLDIPDIRSVITERGDAYRFALLSRAVRPRRAAADEAPLKPVGPMLVLEGLHFAGAAAFCLEQRVIDLAAVPEARTADFSAMPPGSWLLDHVPWTEARHRIGAANADAGQAAHLGIAEGAACLVLERWTWRGGAGVTQARQLFPGPLFDLVATFRPGGA